MSTTSTPFKSRWGYHPCEYALFAKLRRLHKWYWQAVYDFHRWHRWQRKEPQNRVGTKPAVCAAFVENRPWYKPVTVRGEPGFKPYPKTLVDRGLVALYQTVRRPSPDPVPPFDDETRRRIEDLYTEISLFFAD